jgi:DNA mismatch endonuclease Vsr
VSYLGKMTRPTPPDGARARRSAMRQQRTKDTAPELAVRRALRALGLTGYRKHVALLEGCRRTVDIVFFGPRVAVDVRGCFWHACPEHCRRGTSNTAWWTQKLAGNAARDADTEQRLTDAGWLVLVVWEHDDPADAAERIARAVLARRRRPTRSTKSEVTESERAVAQSNWTRLYGAG